MEHTMAVGLMSGTSADGVDAALVEIEGNGPRSRIRLIKALTLPYHPSVREEIHRISSTETGRVDLICRLNFRLGELFAEAAVMVIREARLSPQDVDLIGSHGQTIHHLPPQEGEKGSTLQIGEPAVIAERTGITTVADFRTRDVAAGGHGAPLTPYVHRLLFGDPIRRRVVLNLGGIANVTVVVPECGIMETMAFDTGPGNMAIDGAVKTITGGEMGFDPDGRMAADGRPDTVMLKSMLEHPFFRRKPPKSTGREEFGDTFLRSALKQAEERGLKKEDIISTLTFLTAESVARALETFVYPRFEVDEVIVCGGGAWNRTLLKLLRGRLAPVELKRAEDCGVPSDYLEAIAFAILASETVHGNPANIPSVTGAERPVVLGKIIPGRHCSISLDRNR